MSRSYRKQPILKDHSNGMKTIANRRVRRALNRDFNLTLPNGSYRKFFEQYDICDYRITTPRKFEHYFQNELRRWKENKMLYHYCFKDEPAPDRKERYRHWITKYRGK